MKDSQSPKKPRRFFKKKESKTAQPETQESPQVVDKEEKVVFSTEKQENSVTRESFLVKLRKKIPKPFEKKSKVIKKQTPVSLLHQLETDLQLALIPLILLAILSILMLLNNHFLKVIADNKIQHIDSVSEMQPFPLAENVIPPDLSAKAAIVLDADSQVILLSKNPDLRFSMASTTKIMTALTALDHYKPNDVLTVKTYGVEGSGLGLIPGSQLTFKDLLYAMMLPSANDAAVAIADNYPGGKEAFVKKMNEKALLLHLTNTHFADPAGLNDDGNYTTVIDLSRLSSYAMKNKLFAEVVGTKEKVIYTTSYSMEYPLSNLNKLLGTKGVNGVKTGTTEGAGEVLVTSMTNNGHTYIIVVMNSKDRFADTTELVDFVNEKVQYVVPRLP